jgi:hypothetical protein
MKGPMPRVAVSAAVLSLLLLAGCPDGPLGPSPNPPGVSPPAARPPTAPPVRPVQTAALPLTDEFDRPELPDWYPIGRGLVRRTAEGQMQLSDTPGSTGFVVLHSAFLPDRVAIEFDCQALRYRGYINLIFAASRNGKPFATDPELTDTELGISMWIRGNIDNYLLAWHTGYRAAHFADGKAKALLQKNPRGPDLASADNQDVAADQRERPYHFRITKDGGRIKVSVDGHVKMTGQDPRPHGPGHLGFRILGDRTGSFSCLIDNVQVTALP